jgi:precorrin-6B methylase 2
MSTQTVSPPDQSAGLSPERILKMMWAFAPPLIIQAAVEQGVFDALDGKTLSAEQLSEATGASRRGIPLLADALVGLELLNKTSRGEYQLAPEAAAFLVRGKPGFQGSIFNHVKSDLIPSWLQLSEAVRSGQPARAVNREEQGSAFFEQFVEALFPMAYPAAQALAASLQLTGRDGQVSVLDIGAGSGVWGIALAQSSPQVHVRAVDWERVLPVTRKTAGRFGVQDRFQFVPGNGLEADLGTGHTVAVLGQLLHSEGIDRSKLLLRRVHQALRPGGTIAIAEFLVNRERTGPPQGLIFGLNMLVNTEEGATYSFEEIADWLRETGFENVRMLDAPGPSPLILANKR